MQILIATAALLFLKRRLKFVYFDARSTSLHSLNEMYTATSNMVSVAMTTTAAFVRWLACDLFAQIDIDVVIANNRY